MTLRSGIASAARFRNLPVLLAQGAADSAYYDFSDLSSMSQSSSSQINVTGTSQPVGRIKSKISSLDLIQATSAARGTTAVDDNGIGCVNMDGTDDSYIASSNWGGLGKTITVLCAARNTVKQTFVGTIYEIAVSASTNSVGCSLRTSTTTSYGYNANTYGTARVETIVPDSDTNNVVLIGAQHNLPNPTYISFNRVITNNAASAGNRDYPSLPFRVGARDGSSLFLKGLLYQLMITSKKLTASQILLGLNWISKVKMKGTL